MYAHLEVCPAGVVCCTMEWNRWPISSLDYTSYESLSRGVEEAEQLDMALALQDQRTLLESLKVIAMAPTVDGSQHFPLKKENRATDSDLLRSASESSVIQSSSSCPPQPSPTDSAKDRIASGINGLNEEHFSKLYEATVETARSLVAALEIVSSANSVESSTECARRATTKQSFGTGSSDDLQNGPRSETPEATEGLNKMSEEKILNLTNEALPEDTKMCEKEVRPVIVQDDINSELPQEPATPPMASPVHVCRGVAQRAGHVVLQDTGLVPSENSGHKDKFHRDQFLREASHASLPNGQTSFTPDSSLCRSQSKMEDKSVDTSDLEQDDNTVGVGEIDPISAALLFCLEESRECKRISDTVYIDGYRVDFGTQTFTFPAAILLTNTRVGDMASASACDHAAPQLAYPSPFHSLRLGLVLEALEVEAVPHNRYLPANPRYQQMFPFVCGQPLRRDQFSSHFTNVHGDIHAALNGWMEHRCPLAYYGCTFSQRRFYPSTPGAKVVHSRHLRSFGVQPCPSINPPSASQSDQFSKLPFEILRHIARYLDSFSLCQLSLVSWTLREVCASLLESRGIVELQWERIQRPGVPGSVAWQIKKKVSRNAVLGDLNQQVGYKVKDMNTSICGSLYQSKHTVNLSVAQF